jgi:hypothetical protein
MGRARPAVTSGVVVLRGSQHSHYPEANFLSFKSCVYERDNIMLIRPVCSLLQRRNQLKDSCYGILGNDGRHKRIVRKYFLPLQGTRDVCPADRRSMLIQGLLPTNQTTWCLYLRRSRYISNLPRKSQISGNGLPFVLRYYFHVFPS